MDPMGFGSLPIFNGAFAVRFREGTPNDRIHETTPSGLGTIEAMDRAEFRYLTSDATRQLGGATGIPPNKNMNPEEKL